MIVLSVRKRKESVSNIMLHQVALLLYLVSYCCPSKVSAMIQWELKSHMVGGEETSSRPKLSFCLRRRKGNTTIQNKWQKKKKNNRKLLPLQLSSFKDELLKTPSALCWHIKTLQTACLFDF